MLKKWFAAQFIEDKSKTETQIMSELIFPFFLRKRLLKKVKKKVVINFRILIIFLPFQDTLQ